MSICPTVFDSDPVPTVNSIRLACSRESGDASTHGRHARTDLVGGHRAVPIKGSLKLLSSHVSADRQAHLENRQVNAMTRGQSQQGSGPPSAPTLSQSQYSKVLKHRHAGCERPALLTSKTHERDKAIWILPKFKGGDYRPLYSCADLRTCPNI